MSFVNSPAPVVWLHRGILALHALTHACKEPFSPYRLQSYSGLFPNPYLSSSEKERTSPISLSVHLLMLMLSFGVQVHDLEEVADPQVQHRLGSLEPALPQVHQSPC